MEGEGRHEEQRLACPCPQTRQQRGPLHWAGITAGLLLCRTRLAWEGLLVAWLRSPGRRAPAPLSLRIGGKAAFVAIFQAEWVR